MDIKISKVGNFWQCAVGYQLYLADTPARALGMWFESRQIAIDNHSEMMRKHLKSQKEWKYRRNSRSLWRKFIDMVTP